MILSKEEQKMYDGERGEAKQIAMEILVALGKIYSAENMVKVTSVQVAGVSYKTIGDAGLEFISDMKNKGARVLVPSFLNPAGMDREQWEEMGVPIEFAKKQIQIFDAYEGMGINPTYTCTPYLIGIRPKLGEHIAWSESSAIVFANSVLGARTNREGGPSALAAAICGVTPNYGLHLDSERVAQVAIELDESVKLVDRADFGLFGLKVGALVKEKYPAFSNLSMANSKPDEDALKYMGAAMAASGSVPLFFAKGITPEYTLSELCEKVIVTSDDLEEARAKIGPEKIVDLIATGCPHASLKEIEEVVTLIKEGNIPKTKLWICCARQIKKQADSKGYTKIIESVGGRIVADTCMVVSPVEDMVSGNIAVNSGKAAKYVPSMCKRDVVFGRLSDLLKKSKRVSN
jgi:predicted aconitase